MKIMYATQKNRSVSVYIVHKQRTLAFGSIQNTVYAQQICMEICIKRTGFYFRGVCFEYYLSIAANIKKRGPETSLFE